MKAKTVAKEYTRFTSGQRAEHWVMMIAFTVLAVTGLPQKFAGNDIAEALIRLMGGIEGTRNLHHIAAIVLLLEGVYHLMDVGYKVFVQRVRWTMFPQLQDLFDALNTFFYNLGMRKEAPKFDRYAFGEKFEYWALIWGTVIMALTGFMLWNPIITTRILPGEYIPAAKAAHGAEAILAVLAILIWHFYNVHIRTFNRAMFNGRLKAHQMEEEHALELARLNQGQVDRQPPPERIAARRRTFVPAAVIVAFLMMGIVYLFTSAETTAVTTVPRARPTVQVFVPQVRTPTPTITRQPTRVPATATAVPPTPAPGQPTLTPAPVQPTAVVAQPTAAPAGGATDAKALPATHAGRTTCQACHATGVAGAPKNPADHDGRLDTTCKDCHKGP